MLNIIKIHRDNILVFLQSAFATWLTTTTVMIIYQYFYFIVMCSGISFYFAITNRLSFNQMYEIADFLCIFIICDRIQRVWDFLGDNKHYTLFLQSLDLKLEKLVKESNDVTKQMLIASLPYLINFIKKIADESNDINNPPKEKATLTLIEETRDNSVAKTD